MSALRSIALILAMILLFGSGASAAPTSSPAIEPPLPQRIADFRLAIQHMDDKQVLAEATKRFGPSDHDPGSGVSMPCWDIDGGTLMCHPLSGPTFTTAGGKFVWLLWTKNPVRSNIVGYYEATTLPDPKNHGNCKWIGGLDLHDGGTYAWRDAKNGLDAGDQSRNFFMLHTRGTVNIELSPGVSEETLLEDFGVGTVSHLNFKADTGETFRCGLMSHGNARLLTLEWPDKPCELHRGWKKQWPSKP